MSSRIRCGMSVAVVVSVFLGSATARGQVREAAAVEHSAVILHEVTVIPDRGIPESLLKSAQGFAIVPGLIKAGFIVGGRFGRGIVVVRDASTGLWSNPVFITLAGGSVGWQVGAQATDLVLVFRTRRSIDGFLQNRGKFTLGADASVAAGPVGRQASAGTDIRLESEILSYSRNRGLFAGVSLEGAVLKLDVPACTSYYGQVVLPFEVLTRHDLPAPASAVRLKTMLSQLTGAPLEVPAAPPSGPPPAVPALPVEPAPG